LPDLRFERAVRTRAVEVGARRLDVTVASLRARLAWSGRGSIGGFGFTVATPVAVAGAQVGRTVVPWFVRGLGGSAAALLARRLTVERRESGVEEDGMPELERVGSLVGGAARPEEMVKALTTVASGAGAVGPVTTVGDRSVIPLVETMFSGGYGGGGGGGTSGEGGTEEGLGGGGGGGGGGRSRTVAVVEVAPEGVTIRPVIDRTAIALAVITGAFGLVTAIARRRR
jgi:uncharacterized spore protein YtfJ